MTVATRTQPDSTTQTGTTYKSAIDSSAKVDGRISGAFAAHEQSTPNMTVRVDAGAVPQWMAAPLEVAAQATGTFTAPIGNPRKDIVYVDAKTGVVGVATGTPGASPADPAIPAGKVAVARVTLQTSSTAITNNMLDDLRTPSFYGMGTAATKDTGTNAGNVPVLDGSARLPAVDASQLTGITAGQILGLSTVDQTARDNIALTNLRLLLSTAITSGALAQGYQWELATDEWATGSSGYTFTSASPNSYGNPGTAATSYSNTGGSGNRAGVVTVTASGWGTISTPANLVDGTTSGQTNTVIPTNGASIAGVYLIFDFGVGASKVIDEITIYLQAASSQGTWKCQGSNDGSSFTDIGSSFAVGSSNPSVHAISGATIGYRYLKLSGVSGTASNVWWQEINFKIASYSAPGNMTLLSPAISVSSAPSAMVSYLLWKDDSGTAVLGTDFTVELSRDGGTTWTTATLTTVAAYDGTYSVIKARADVSSQPSGTSMKSRAKTLNTKAQRVAAPALYTE